MSLNTRFTTLTRTGIVAAMATALLAGCSAPGANSAQETTSTVTTQATSVNISEAWIKAADNGMTGAFAVLENNTDKNLELVSVSSPLAETVELHDMVGSGTSMSMTPIEGPLVIPARGRVELAPGKQHVMLMGLKQHLEVGSDPTLTFNFADKSTQAVIFEVKSYTGANESYAPDHGGKGTDHSMKETDHGGKETDHSMKEMDHGATGESSDK